MTQEKIREILDRTDYIRTSGSEEEKAAAVYLAEECRKYGVQAALEPFDVWTAEIREAVLTADGREIPCKGYKLCGSGSVEAPLCYLPNTDPASCAQAKGKIVLLDTGITYWVYHDLLNAGAVGFITYDGDIHFEDRDIDQKMLRPYVSLGKKVPCVNINAKDAFELVKSAPASVSIRIEQEETAGESQNVVAEIPGRTDEWIVLTAHYDSTPLSHGAYDNMSGCVGLLGIMEALREKAPLRYGLRFVFCGSEEVGLLGSKAYTAAHEKELGKVALNINLDMIGTYMGIWDGSSPASARRTSCSTSLSISAPCADGACTGGRTFIPATPPPSRTTGCRHCPLRGLRPSPKPPSTTAMTRRRCFPKPSWRRISISSPTLRWPWRTR